MKLFLVEKKEHSYRHTQTVFSKYFLANSIETVKAVVKDRYGELKQYFREDDAEIEIQITELEVEIL